MFQRAKQVAFCRHCKYDLRGHELVETTRCPECGLTWSKPPRPLRLYARGMVLYSVRPWALIAMVFVPRACSAGTIAVAAALVFATTMLCYVYRHAHSTLIAFGFVEWFYCITDERLRAATNTIVASDIINAGLIMAAITMCQVLIATALIRRMAGLARGHTIGILSVTTFVLLIIGLSGFVDILWYTELNPLPFMFALRWHDRPVWAAEHALPLIFAGQILAMPMRAIHRKGGSGMLARCILVLCTSWTVLWVAG
jgi:hypothetical protein